MGRPNYSEGHMREATFEEQMQYATLTDAEGNVIRPEDISYGELLDWLDENDLLDMTGVPKEVVATGELYRGTENYHPNQPRDSRGRFGSGGGGGGGSLSTKEGLADYVSKNKGKAKFTDLQLAKLEVYNPNGLKGGVVNVPKAMLKNPKNRKQLEAILPEGTKIKLSGKKVSKSQMSPELRKKYNLEGKPDVPKVVQPKKVSKKGGVDKGASTKGGVGDNRTLSRQTKDTPVSPAMMDSAENTEWACDNEPGMAEAVGFYTEAGYDIVNDGLRTGDWDLSVYGSDTIEDIEMMYDAPHGKVKSWIKKEVVHKLDDLTSTDLEGEGATVYRGLGSHTGKKILAQAEAGGHPVIVDKAFQSTSTDPDTAAAFSTGTNIVMQITAKRGAYLEEVSSSSGEYEFLMPRKTKLRVDGVDHNVTLKTQKYKAEDDTYETGYKKLTVIRATQVI